MAKKSIVLQGTEREFIQVFKQLCYTRSTWEVWADLMSMIACFISNAVDRTPEEEAEKTRTAAEEQEQRKAVAIKTKEAAPEKAQKQELAERQKSKKPMGMEGQLDIFSMTEGW